MERFKHRLEELVVVSDKQIQKAGENSQQIQAGSISITNVMGIDEKRAREIFNEMYVVARRDFSKDAYECANERVAQFEESLMPKIMQIDGALEKFADPSFQFLITEAHKTAAATERVADYDLLSELLVHRIQKGEKNRKVRAGVARAVEIVDQIDDDALCALTVSHAVGNLFPIANSVNEGLDVLEDTFSKLIYTELPRGRDWLDHLEILDAVRLSSFGNLKKIEQFYPEQFNGYACVGIPKGTDKYDNTISLLEENRLPNTLLVDHELLDGYVRLPICTKTSIDSLRLVNMKVVNGQLEKRHFELSREQKDVLEEVFDLYDTNVELKKKVVDRFMGEWKKRKALSSLCEWWDNIPIVFQITAVGKVLAHSNAQRCDKSIPPLE